MFISNVAALSDNDLLNALEWMQRSLQSASEPNPLYMANRDEMVRECVRRRLIAA